jgi:hypothetical protein
MSGFASVKTVTAIMATETVSRKARTVSRNRNVRFQAQTYHRWNCDESCTACYNTENARKEENRNQENQLWR